MPDPISFPDATPRFALPLLHASQARKELFHNEALARLDSLLHASVLGESRLPPQSPAEGDCWLVAAVPEAEWAENAGSLAMFLGGAWQFAEPVAGMRLFDESSGQSSIFWRGWQKAPPVEEPSGGLYVDSQARAAIGALISALRAAGIYPSALRQ